MVDKTPLTAAREIKFNNLLEQDRTNYRFFNFTAQNIFDFVSNAATDTWNSVYNTIIGPALIPEGATKSSGKRFAEACFNALYQQGRMDVVLGRWKVCMYIFVLLPT